MKRSREIEQYLIFIFETIQEITEIIYTFTKKTKNFM